MPVSGLAEGLSPCFGCHCLHHLDHVGVSAAEKVEGLIIVKYMHDPRVYT